MNSFKIKLKNIKLLRSEVRDHPIVFSEGFNIQDVQLEVDSKFNFSDKYLQNFMHFKFEIEDSGKVISLGHFDIIYTFEVNRLEDIVKDEVTKKSLQLNIISIAYSTSRGILYSETKGYSLNDIHLQPISPNDFYQSLLKDKAETEDLSISID
ncbi:hypothetical protein [Membranihabitans marinus]|uniref:hypothetical protein n=1 Tax=Membranihabitans marinus TaxID=1227546 RepID=UPI001F2625AA|nr:hypothetical protein [Membranihabitans marinus]